MAKINSIGNSSGSLTVDPGASGDSFVQFSIAGTPEFIIGVDDTDDSFRISNGSALGTNDTFIMTAAGENTMPLQPCSMAYANLQSDVTGDATLYTNLYAGGEYFDQNNDFSSPTFTAPVTGKYLLVAHSLLSGLTASHTTNQFRITTSNNIYVAGKKSLAFIKDASDQVSQECLIIVDMDASDTATIVSYVVNGTKVVDILATETTFAAYLIS